jgi:hypothetical protein
MTVAATLELADDVYFLVYDGVRGKARLHARAVNFGLASGLIAELVLSGWATVDGGVLTAVDVRPCSPENVRTAQPPPVHPLWRALVAEPWRLPMRAWLDAFGAQAHEVVTERLFAGGHLRGRRPVAVNMNTAGWPVARLRGALGRCCLERWQDVVLLALAEAIGVGSLLLDDLEPSALAYAQHAVAELVRYPCFAVLVSQTAASVGGAVLTG